MDTRNKAKTERDREATGQRLVEAVGELIAEEGFETLGVRKVAERAGVNKTLIYRYFDSLDGLIYAYMKKHDFWLNMSTGQPVPSDVKAYMKTFFRRQIAESRSNIALKRLRRWELSSGKELAAEIRANRERNGVQFFEMMAGFATLEKERLRVLTALVDAGIGYLSMLEENCRMYNGIDIQSDEGWKRIAEGIDTLIDIMIK